MTVSAAALTNSMTLLNPPSYIPTTGFFVGEVAYTSNIPSWSYLHMDLNDESNQYAYDGGASLNVTTPGAGTIQLNMSIATALTLQDTIGIHLYMASAVNYNLYSAGQANNMDWNHSSFSVYYTALGAPQTQFGNNITIPSPPANIPSTGSFTVQVQWYSNITGLINLHCDLSDISAKYAYDGGGLTQVQGPGAGLANITVQLSTQALAADSLQLHTYMLDEATSLIYQTAAGNNDWNYTLFNAYYPVSYIGSPVTARSSSSGAVQPSTSRSSSSTGSAVVVGTTTATPGSSSSSSSLSGGAIAGIVIGSVVGVALLLAVCFWAFLSRGRGSKLDEHKMSGGHTQHEDEISHTGHTGNEGGEVEMEETHENDA